MNEQAATWNKVLATGQEILKVQKDPHRCVEKKLRNRYHARGSDDQDTSMSIISAEKTLGHRETCILNYAIQTTPII